jgi:RAT1-interacting protein
MPVRLSPPPKSTYFPYIPPPLCLSARNTNSSLSPLVWDCKPDRKDDPINWVELKTSAEIRNDRDMIKYERKLLKFWAQSFLLGVPKIIVGFRDQQGIVHRLEELETASIPGKVKKVGRGTWDGNICINFAAEFMECKSNLPLRYF